MCDALRVHVLQSTQQLAQEAPDLLLWQRPLGHHVGERPLAPFHLYVQLAPHAPPRLARGRPTMQPRRAARRRLPAAVVVVVALLVLVLVPLLVLLVALALVVVVALVRPVALVVLVAAAVE